MTIWSVAPVSMTHSVCEIANLSRILLEKTECSKVGLLKDKRHIGLPVILRGGCVTVAKEVAAWCG